MLRGAKFQIDNSYARAEQEFLAAVKIMPENMALHLALAHSLWSLSRFDEATTAVREAIELEPGSAVAHSGLGAVLAAKGSLDAGIAEQRVAIRLDPNYADGHGNLGVELVQKGDFDGGVAELHEAIRVQPDLAAWRLHLAETLNNKGRADEAITEFGEVIRQKPENAIAHMGLGSAFAQKKKWDQVIAEESTALRLKPQFAEADLFLGIGLMQKNDWEQATSHLRSATLLAPKWASAHDALGWALEHKGDLQGAWHEYYEAYQLDPKDPTILADYSRFLEKVNKLIVGSPDRAQTAPSRPVAAQGIGVIYGTRDPITCPSSRKEPVNGPISVEQATLYFTCSWEKEDEGLYLIENLTLQVGKGRPPTAIEIAYLDDLDHDSLVYPIRGSFTDYHCYTQRSAPGRNCSTSDEPEAEGKCYRTSFGDWTCSMVDNQHLLYNQRENVPPPPLR